MKKLLLVFFFFGIYYQAHSQGYYGNEWIQYDQTYFKLRIWKDGMYRINSSTLQNSGVPLNSVNGSNLRLYGRGQEIPIYVTTTGILGPDDYIEFYGVHNDGFWDSTLYADHNWMANEKLSLFNDTAYYFLTWNNTPSTEHYVTTANNIAGAPPKEPYCWTTASYVGGTSRATLCKGATTISGQYLYNSDLSNTEGYIDPFFENAAKDFAASTPHAYTAGPNAELTCAIVAYGYGDLGPGLLYNHNMVINVNGNQIWSGSYFGFTVVRLDETNVAASWLTTPSTTLEFTTAASATADDYNSISWWNFKYARVFDFDNATNAMFDLTSNGSAQFIELTGLDEAGTTPVLYDITNKVRMKAVVQNDTEKFLLPVSNLPERKIFITADDSSLINTVDSIWPVHFVDYSLAANQGNFIIISHPALMMDSLGNNWVQQYADMKEDPLLNPVPWTSVVADINVLYDEFAYGIRYHPAAIRKFAQYIYDKWQPQVTRYMFLIGKGIEYSDMNLNATLKPLCFVPTMGSPGSDLLLTARGYSATPLLPIGRLPVLSAGEIEPYLDKVKQFVGAQNSTLQTVANKAWMKRAMHLCGGTNASDQLYFLSFLNSYKLILEDTLFGGQVTTFQKDNNAPIQLATNETIDSLLTTGVSLITFFGHSSYNSFDFNLDRPEVYHNDGKYPLILSNGCLIGNLFVGYHGIADSFVIADHSGAIGFMGPSVFSIASSLNTYSGTIYNNLSWKKYNYPIGDVIAQSVADVENNSDLDRSTAEQMLLAGDPSLKLNTHDKPDYDLESQYLSFDPPAVSAGLDSFYIQIIAYNLGMAVDDSIYLDVKRTLPGGTQEFLYHKKIKAPYYIDTIRLVVKTEGTQAFGLNQFYVKIDAGSDSSFNGDVDELSENNNVLNPTLLINADDILPVWPYDYSIVSEQGVTLKASTVNAFAAPKQYVIQIDTTQLFNSPLLLTKTIFQSGGVVKWTPTFTMRDSTVYYWRTSVDTTGGTPFTWHNASFIYLPGSSPGWNQSHYYQLLSTIQTNGNIELPDTRQFKYVDDIKTISVYNGNTLWVGGPLAYDDPAFYLNGVRLGKWDCANCGASILIAVIDSQKGFFWMDTSDAGGCDPAMYGSIQCHGSDAADGFYDSRPYFFYPVVWYPYISDLDHFLTDTIPDGDYILIMSQNNMNVPGWDSSMKNIFTNLGLTQIQNITSDVPYVAFFKKHDPNYPTYELVGDTFTSVIDTSFNFTGEWTDGYVESPLIGPAASWSSLHWKVHSLEPNTDHYSLQLLGINTAGGEVTLVNNVMASDTSLAGIDAKQYPYLRLKLNCLDTVNRTPVQLDFWRINYQPVPEAALNPAAYFSLDDTVHQFVPLTLSVAVENISPWDMDSMLMNFQITDATNVLHSYTKRYQPLAGNDTLHATYHFESGCNCFVGTNYLYVEANPDDDQPEQYHFNNIGITTFNEAADDLNPLLDVTFDGIHIFDGDIVSAKPDIMIMLKDDNAYVPINDTSAFDIYFIYPDGSRHNVVFDNVHAFFYPADSNQLAKDNTASAELKEEFLTDGKYNLYVQGYDRSGNASGGNAYHISFTVINKPMISNVLNYPNPFSTSTRFVFTLTGYEIPQQMKITIYTISGKVVKEIFISELGNLHIGNNITDYTFDGTDQYGDKLANGLYFYKVEALLNGKGMDHYDNGTSQYFKRGIGKMYLMR